MGKRRIKKKGKAGKLDSSQLSESQLLYMVDQSKGLLSMKRKIKAGRKMDEKKVCNKKGKSHMRIFFKEFKPINGLE